MEYDGPNRLRIALNLLGVAVVGYALVVERLPGRPTWALVVALAGVAAWLGRTVLALVGVPRSLSLAFAVAMVVAASVSAAPTNGLAVAPALIAIVLVTADPEVSWGSGVALAVASGALIAVGAAIVGAPGFGALALLGGVVLAVFVGFSRRQFRRSQQQAALLRDRELTVREERGRIELLAERQSLARDIHDVLAHSLGGLVIQLDAVDALLEAGEVDAARKRVTDARALAASGLGDARRAVAALRDPEAAATLYSPSEADPLGAFSTALADLVGAHRSIGGDARFAEQGAPHPLAPAQATALYRALQECLSNARKHAPDAPVTVDLHWSDTAVQLRVANPITPPEYSSAAARLMVAHGSGNGIEGMRVRVDALRPPGSVAVEAGDEFVVRVTVRLA